MTIRKVKHLAKEAQHIIVDYFLMIFYRLAVRLCVSSKK